MMSDNDEDSSKMISREEKVMKKFLEGKLHLGSSLSITQKGVAVSFALKGKTALKLSKWWSQRKIHPAQRTMNAHLILHENPHEFLPQISRDIQYRKAPYDRLTITLTPAELYDDKGKVKTSSLKDEHRNIPGAPKFPLHDIDRSVGHMNLMKFINDTLQFKKKLDDIEAEKKANWRPFITPRRVVDPVQPRLKFSNYHWLPREEEEVESNAAILTQVESIAMQAVILHHSQQSLIPSIENSDGAR